ncbi:MAG: hypothetical protein ACREL3_03770 [Gemmatimonadales bacterium]
MAAPLSAQRDASQDVVWRIGGLRNGFCVLLLVEPQLASRSLPAGLRLVTAGQANDLHPALKSEVEAQPELGAWSPSHLCFYAMDTVQTDDYQLSNKSGRKPQLLALWTVGAEETGSGNKRDVALLILTTNERLIRSGRLAGQVLREVEATLGKAPEVDENGHPSGDDRFQIKMGNTLITWDGRQARDSSAVSGSVAIAWAASAGAARKGNGSLTLTPQWASPMVGALKVEGKDDLAKALQGSPVRFVGPLYRGGGGEIRLQR